MKRLFLALSLLGVSACSDGTSTKDEGRAPSFRGLYTANGEGVIGDLAFTDDGGYVLRAQSCRSEDCLEAGKTSYDARAKTLTLGARTLRVEIVDETRSIETTVRPRDLVERDGGLVEDAGVALTETVTEARLDGQGVRLVDGQQTLLDAGSDGGSRNSTTPPWPGSIPGIGPLRSPADTEVTTVQPGGNSVTVARPGDAAFADDTVMGPTYAGRANIYNSHGMPGILYGGIPEAQVRSFLNDSSDPLIVASCFSGAAMSGGSTIRRLVSAYADDPLVASRVYGCTGWTIVNTQVGYACTGAWVDANQQAVPLVDRQRLGLIQIRCARNTIEAGRPAWDECHDPH